MQIRKITITAIIHSIMLYIATVNVVYAMLWSSLTIGSVPSRQKLEAIRRITRRLQGNIQCSSDTRREHPSRMVVTRDCGQGGTHQMPQKSKRRPLI